MFKRFLLLVILGIFLGYLFFFLNSWFLNTTSTQEFEEVRNQPGILQKVEGLREAVALMPSLLGYEKPKTYLVLFLNNTEIRPGGGFIGSYALVQLDKRQITKLETNGSENLDWSAPQDFNVEPPTPIKTYLKQPRWFFRDANWSPDFPTSARKVEEFYRLEGGKEGDKIDGVIGITPTVIEILMKYTGQITVAGQIFTAENFINALEYHVEYGYKEAGIDMSERKVILGDLSREFLKKIVSLPASQWPSLWSEFLKLTSERQIMIYANDDNLQKLLAKNNWIGEVKNTTDDFLLVVDSNLASLKTDPSVKRKIIYSVFSENNRWRVRLEIHYDHQGHFDWKTTRYRTYTRIYVPAGSELIESDGFMNLEKKPVAAEVGQELCKTVFGGFLSIEPQTKKALILEYYLPDKIFSSVAGMYTLFVQKALGSQASSLTINLNFGKNKAYHEETDLRVDREFKANLK